MALPGVPGAAVSQGRSRACDLASFGPALKLKASFGDACQAGRRHRIGGEAATGRVHGKLSAHRREAAAREFARFSGLAEPECLTGQQLVIGCDVAYLSQVEIMSRIADGRLLIGAARRRFERAESPQVPLA